MIFVSYRDNSLKLISFSAFSQHLLALDIISDSERIRSTLSASESYNAGEVKSVTKVAM